jgi:hypothetical protein
MQPQANGVALLPTGCCGDSVMTSYSFKNCSEACLKVFSFFLRSPACDFPRTLRYQFSATCSARTRSSSPVVLRYWHP